MYIVVEIPPVRAEVMKISECGGGGGGGRLCGWIFLWDDGRGR